MKMRTRLLFHCCVVALLCGVGAVRAWGHNGHATTGAIADALIAGTHADVEVQRRLRGQGESLRNAAVWPDCAKAVQWQGSAFAYTEPGTHPECQPFETPEGQARSVAYVAANWSGCGLAAGQEPCHKQYHYTDVAIQHLRYDRRYVGTSPHDLVAAMQASIAVLQGLAAPPPFHFADQTEALLLLAHLVGDVHQPLHVGAIYLDAHGHRVNPDAGHHDLHTDTVGGNRIDTGHGPLHRDWDEVPARLGPQQLGVQGVAAAAAIRVTPGQPMDWPLTWATETMHASRVAYQDMGFDAYDATLKRWPARLPEGYEQTRQAVQQVQLTKAGARLAQLLMAIFP